MKYPPRKMTVEHLNWLYLVFGTELPHQAKLIAAYLNTYMNAKQHDAWPSIGRMQSDCSMSRSTIVRYITVLVDEGWLSKKQGGVFHGRNTPSTYTMRWPKRIKSSMPSEQSETEKPIQTPLSTDEQGGVCETPPSVCETPPSVCETPPSVCETPPSVCETPKSERESERESVIVKPPAVPASDDYVSFDDFWAIWPKRVAKSAAQKAWKKLKPDAKLLREIYENLEKHAHAKDWEDAQYIPNPATYLNGRRWEDQVIIRSRPGARPEDHDKAQRMAKILEGIPL